MASYSVAEAKNNLPKLIDRAVAGEDVTITRRGRPLVKIVPETPAGLALDVEWLKQHILTPRSGVDFDSAALIREMRDEGY